MGSRAKDRIAASRLWPLFLKEFHQLRRNRRLVLLLFLPPVLNIILFGYTLNPTFENLRLGIVDDSRTPESRGSERAWCFTSAGTTRLASISGG